MSILIDKIITEVDMFNISQQKDSTWYLAKPIPFYSWRTKYNQIKDGIRVMRGKSFAVHYKEDE